MKYRICKETGATEKPHIRPPRTESELSTDFCRPGRSAKEEALKAKNHTALAVLMLRQLPFTPVLSVSVFQLLAGSRKIAYPQISQCRRKKVARRLLATLAK